MAATSKTVVSGNPLFNLITRTSNRPILFGECQQSIQIQTYPNEYIRRYVTFDDESDLDTYIQNYTGFTVMEMDSEKRKNQSHFPYHSYLNEVISHLEEEKSNGWIIILDDDNQLAQSTSLEHIAKVIADNGSNPNKFFIWKCQYGDRVVPSEASFKKVPKAGDLHISCYAFHVSQAEHVNFEAKKGAEYDVVGQLFNHLDCVWIDAILTHAPTSGNGTREDRKTPSVAITTATTAAVAAPVPPKKKLTLKPVVPMPAAIKQLLPSDSKPNIRSQIIDDPDLDDPDLDADIDVDAEDDNPPADEEEEEEEEIQNEEDQGEDSDEEALPSEPNDAPTANATTTPSKDMPAPAPTSAIVSATQETSKSPITALATPTAINLGAEVVQSLGGDNTELLVRLVNLLKTGKRVYIFDENNMQKLSKCVFDALSCVDLEDKLVNALERNILEHKTHELQTKLQQIASSGSTTTNAGAGPSVGSSMTTSSGRQPETDRVDQLLSRYKSNAPQSQPNQPVQAPSQGQNRGVAGELAVGFIDKIYLLTDNDSVRNPTLERNRKILGKCKCDLEIIRCKDMSLYQYQMRVGEMIKDAKGKGYKRIVFMNGNDPINNKFADLLDRQIGRLRGECHLWFFGNVRDTSHKDIMGTEFDLDDYLFLYEDIVNAKLTTQEKALSHWKTYGYREGRYAKIDVTTGFTSPIQNNNGFAISAELYDKVIDLINRQTLRDTKNVLIDLQTAELDSKYVWCSRPDLIVPAFGNANNHLRNGQIALKLGLYYNFYKIDQKL